MAVLGLPRPAAREVPRQGRRLRRGQGRAALLLVAPFAVVFTLFTAVPVVLSFAMAFTDTRSTDLRDLLGVNLVGLDNFVTLLTTPAFLQAIGNTLVFVVVGVPLTMLLGFALAVVLDTGIRRLRTTYRALFYAPVVTNMVAVAVIWRFAFGLEGPVNGFLEAVGLGTTAWLGDSTTAMPIIIALGVWKNFGTAMVLFLAGLQTVPAEVHEAAALDGAGMLRRIRSIVVPLLRPTTLLVSVLLTTFFLQVFDEPFLVTGGGPSGATRSIALWTYEQFGFGAYAMASASSYVLVALVAVVAVVQFRLLRSAE